MKGNNEGDSPIQNKHNKNLIKGHNAASMRVS